MGRNRKWPPSVHLHHSGQSFIRVDGKDYYLGKHGSPEAQKEYVRLIGELANGKPAPVKPVAGITVNVVFAAWLNGPGQKYSQDGRERQQYVYSFRPVVRLYGATSAAAFGVDELEAVQETMITGSWMSAETRAACQKQNRPVGWSKNVVNRRIVRIRTVWKWAERRKLVPPGSHSHLQTVEGIHPNHSRVRTTKPVRPPAWEDVEKAIAVCSRAPAAMMALMWWSGMRPDEVRGLNLAELDRSGDVWIYDPRQHKNAWRGQQRIVPLGAKCQAVLGPWIAAAETAGRQLVFPARGDGYNAFSFAQAVRRACKRAKVPHFTPKALRHAAKRRITRAEGMDSARQLLGQKSIGTTAGYDAEIDTEHAINIARKHG